MSAALADRLDPKHLTLDPEQLRMAAEGAAPEEAPAPVDWESDPRSQEEWPFKLDYLDPVGRRWQGSFTSKILTNGELLKKGHYRAGLHGHADLAGFDVQALSLSQALSHLEFALVKENRPKWAENLLGLKNYDVVWALFAKVVEHEDFFRGAPPVAGSSGGQPGGKPSAAVLGEQASAAG